MLVFLRAIGRHDGVAVYKFFAGPVAKAFYSGKYRHTVSQATSEVVNHDNSEKT